jgi:Tol biopolymer transport system component
MRLPVIETYNLHILRACASHAATDSPSPPSVRCSSSRDIITPLYPLSGPNCQVNHAQLRRRLAAHGNLPGVCRYRLASLVLAALVPVSSLPAQTVSEVQVTPETMTLGVGQKQAIFATAFDQRGNLIPTAKFAFWSSDTLIAQVRKDGTVVGVKPGLAKIEARSMGKRASLAVLITGGPASDNPGTRAASSAAVLTLDPPSVSLFPGERVRIVPQGLKDDGTPAPLGRVTWKALKPEVAKLDTGGYVVGMAPGRTIVQVASGRLMATLPVEVTQADFVLSPTKLSLGPGEVDTIRALIPSQGNREIRGMLQWRSTDTAVASVSPTGIVSGRGAGQAEIVVSGFSQERRATAVVHRVPDALVVSPPQSGGPIQVPLRATRQFTAVAQAADSTPISEARVSWELSDSTVATFDPGTGLLTPKALGTTTLTARLAGITPAVWTIQIVAGEIALEPSRAGLLVGQRTTLKPLLRDQAATGSRTPGAQWSSDRSEVATVREGMVDALSPGRAVITATMPWGKKATADIFVVGDLLLSSNRTGSYGIYQMRAPGPATLLPVLVDSATNIQAVLSPDRTRVVFSSNRNGNFDIYLMDPDGQNLRRLTSAAGNEGEPAWTPDGMRIVYTSTIGTNSQIAIMSADGGESRQLTTASGGNHSPTVSADGRTIAFVSARDGNHAIYTMGLDGSNQRRLVKGSARQTSPRFFRNGDLAYVVERGGSKGSKVVRWSGGGETQLVETEQPISYLAVSRDGDRMAYVVAQIKDASKGRVDFSFFLQSTAPGSRSVAVPLKPGEQILSPAF